MAETDRRETLEIVRRCFAAWDRGDLEGVLAQYADDVVVDASRIAEGVYRGKRAVRAFYAGIFESTAFTNEGTEYLASGERILVVTRIAGAGLRSGAPMDAPFAYLFSVDDGAVREVVFYPDEAEGRRELG